MAIVAGNDVPGALLLAKLRECLVDPSESRHQRTAGLIHDFVVQMLFSGDVEAIDALLRQVDVTEVTSFELCSLLISTNKVRDSLSSRAEFRERAQAVLVNELGEAEASRVLRFL